jgi:hypothetical protein
MSIHTVTGQSVGDILCTSMAGQTWGRERNEVSRAEVAVATAREAELLDELIPWHHWGTLWDGSEPIWTGPIQRVAYGRDLTQVSLRDTSTFMWRTRVPITKAWEGMEPERIAAEMWAAMLEMHRIRATPVISPDPGGEPFDFQVTADSRMLNATMDELVKVGLNWAVVAGTPLLGQASTQPVAQLQECDFLTTIEKLRDGTNTFNNVRLQGQNGADTYLEPMAGLNLQTLMSMDDLFGVANISRATRQYARRVSRIKDQLVVPASASLHPEAPVTLSDLIPGNRFLVSAWGTTATMVLDQMEVTSSAGRVDVKVTLEAETDLSGSGALQSEMG